MMKVKETINNLKLNTKFTAIIIIFAIMPIAVLAGILFYNMEKNVIDENINYMEYTMERSEDRIMTNVDSINMVTQFFRSDTAITELLNRAVEGDTFTGLELLDFYNTDVASLERLVNNNPLLYAVRIYVANDNIQEMMPILYKKSRMKKLTWADSEDIYGWHYDYYDTIFSSLLTSQDKRLIALVTPITDYENGIIGTIETAMTLDTMFPGMFETVENEWSCFAAEDGTLYFGNEEAEDVGTVVEEALKENDGSKEKNTYFYKDGSEQWVITYMPIEELGGTLVSVRNITSDVEKIYASRNMFVAVMIVILLALTLVINLIVKRLLRQFYVMLKAVRKVQKGDLKVRIEECSRDEMGELGIQLNKMLDRIEQLMQDNINREVLVKNAEIRALQNQINAHFIYNVLESIKMMAEIDEEYAISDAITSLGKMLRYSMKWVSRNVTIKEELEYIKNYMALINIRFDYEIYLSLNVPEQLLDQEIPKMSLQPIVENSILHGIEQMAEDTNIYIKGYVNQNDCILEVTDAGRGMSERDLKALRLKIAGEIETEGGSGHGLGLKNVQDRITMTFGKEYGLEIASREGCYTKVAIRIPLKEGKRHENSFNRGR